MSRGVELELRTRRLEMWRWRDTDLPALAELFAEPAFNWHPYRRRRTPDEAEQFLHHLREHWSTYGFGRRAVCDQTTGELLGYCGLTVPQWPPRDDALEYGIRLGKSSQGRGLGSEAGAAVLAEAFRCSGSLTVVATVEADNIASRRMTARLGFLETDELPHPGHGTMHVIAELQRGEP